MLTLKTTVWAIVINSIFGIVSAWCITKYAFCGKKRISALIGFPVAVSPIIAGFVFIPTFGRQSWLVSVPRKGWNSNRLCDAGGRPCDDFCNLPLHLGTRNRRRGGRRAHGRENVCHLQKRDPASYQMGAPLRRHFMCRALWWSSAPSPSSQDACAEKQTLCRCMSSSSIKDMISPELSPPRVF